ARNIAQLDNPDFLARLGIQRDGVIVERVEEYLAVVISLATIDHIATGNSLRRWIDGGGIFPFDVSGGSIEREHFIGIGAQHIHDAVDHDGGGFMSMIGANGETPSGLQMPDIARV